MTSNLSTTSKPINLSKETDTLPSVAKDVAADELNESKHALKGQMHMAAARDPNLPITSRMGEGALGVKEKVQEKMATIQKEYDKSKLKATADASTSTSTSISSEKGTDMGSCSNPACINQKECDGTKCSSFVKVRTPCDVNCVKGCDGSKHTDGAMGPIPEAKDSSQHWQAAKDTDLPYLQRGAEAVKALGSKISETFTTTGSGGTTTTSGKLSGSGTTGLS